MGCTCATPRKVKTTDSQEELVLTSVKDGSASTVRIERLDKDQINYDDVLYTGGGPYEGILINKAATVLPSTSPAQSCKSFIAHLADNNDVNAEIIQENREVSFWFKDRVAAETREGEAKQYFKELLKPEGFPKDYVGFIKRVLALMAQYTQLSRVEVFARPLTAAEYQNNDIEIIEKKSASVSFADSSDGGAGLPNGHGDGEKVGEPAPQEPEEDEEVYENYITVLTPAVYDYQYLPEVPVSNKTWVCFRLRAKCDAHIALSSVYGDVDRKTYEIVLGGWDNRQSAIRDGGRGPIISEAVTLGELSGDEFREYWLSWDNGKVQVGRGRSKGEEVFLKWDVPKERQHSVNCMAVSGGPGSDAQWEFVEFIYPNRKEDKSERRRLAKLSLLWVAKKQKMLNVLEDAYPNSLAVADLLMTSKMKMSDAMQAVVFLRDLGNRRLIKEVAKGIWMRSPGGQFEGQKHEIQIVDNLPVLSGPDQPTIAIVTALYCEKLAVDAMIGNKVTFVRYKTGGESTVCTIGKIGEHSVISTKLSRVGSGRDAMISAGNTITRLLGAFKSIKHIILVGAGGAVPHYTDFFKHVRLGDVVVSVPQKYGDPLYVHCDKLQRLETGEGYSYLTRSWQCRDDTLQNTIRHLRDLSETDSFFQPPWDRYVEEGKIILQSEESNFYRPSPRTDKLYATINDELLQVRHPEGPKGQYREGCSTIRYGVIGSGRYVARNDKLRMDFAKVTGARAFDGEFDAVLESMEGNRNDSFVIIRGIADYQDGTKSKEWQPYASLTAAAYMKAVVESLPAPRRRSQFLT